MKLFLTLLLVIPIFSVSAQIKAKIAPRDSDQVKVERSVIKWADSTFKEYNEPRFEKYRANYTDEYLIASMRVKSIDRRISELRKEYTMGKYQGTEQEFTDTMEDLKKRRKEAEDNNQDFHPKVTNYVISFWANIRLDSGVLNYVQHKIILNDNYEVIKSKIVGNIGDSENAKIVYR
tara:strand:- start:65168 stop:65698 length:531 start_codon:yes stop_codon:yes gene_type:complete